MKRAYHAYRVCHDCGSRRTETAFPGTHKPYKQADRCCDCLAEFEHLLARLAEGHPEPITARAAARAVYRHWDNTRVNALLGRLSAEVDNARVSPVAPQR